MSHHSTLLLLVGTCAAAATNLKASYDVVVDRHVSDILSLFLADELNREWSPNLVAERSVWTREHGPLSHQTFRLPWPLAHRDVLLHCERRISHRCVPRPHATKREHSAPSLAPTRAHDAISPAQTDSVHPPCCAVAQ